MQRPFSFSCFLSAFAVDFSCTVIFAPDFGEASAGEFSCAGFAAACARSFNSMPARGFISLRPLKMPPSSIWKALTLTSPMSCPVVWIVSPSSVCALPCTVPETSKERAETLPVTMPVSPTITEPESLSSPSISPSMRKLPVPLTSPWIFVFLPMTVSISPTAGPSSRLFITPNIDSPLPIDSLPDSRFLHAHGSHSAHAVPSRSLCCPCRR